MIYSATLFFHLPPFYPAFLDHAVGFPWAELRLFLFDYDVGFHWAKLEYLPLLEYAFAFQWAELGCLPLVAGDSLPDLVSSLSCFPLASEESAHSIQQHGMHCVHTCNMNRTLSGVHESLHRQIR